MPELLPGKPLLVNSSSLVEVVEAIPVGIILAEPGAYKITDAADPASQWLLFSIKFRMADGACGLIFSDGVNFWMRCTMGRNKDRLLTPYFDAGLFPLPTQMQVQKAIGALANG